MGRGQNSTDHGFVRGVLRRVRGAVDLDTALTTALSKSDYRNQLGYASKTRRYQLVRAAVARANGQPSDDLTELVEKLLKTGFHNQAWQFSHYSYEGQQEWRRAVDSELAELDPVQTKELTDAGLDLEALRPFLQIDRRPFLTGHTILLRQLAERILAEGHGPEVVEDREFIEETGRRFTAARAAQFVPRSLEAALGARKTLAAPAGQASDEELLSALVDGLHVAASGHIYWSGSGPRRYNWQKIGEDWHNWRRYRDEATEGMPEGLRHGYDPGKNAVTQLAKLLSLDTEVVADAIERVADYAATR